MKMWPIEILVHLFCARTVTYATKEMLLPFLVQESTMFRVFNDDNESIQINEVIIDPWAEKIRITLMPQDFAATELLEYKEEITRYQKAGFTIKTVNPT